MASQVAVMVPSARVTVIADGVAGGVVGGACGVAETYQGEAVGAAVPVPPGLTARRWKRYSVPLVRPVMVWEVVVAPLSGMAVHWPQATPAQRIWYS